MASSKSLQNLVHYPRLMKEEPCSRKAIAVKVPQSQFDAWMVFSSEERNAVLRNAIAQYLKKNGVFPE